MNRWGDIWQDGKKSAGREGPDNSKTHQRAQHQTALQS